MYVLPRMKLKNKVADMDVAIVVLSKFEMWIVPIVSADRGGTTSYDPGGDWFRSKNVYNALCFYAGPSHWAYFGESPKEPLSPDLKIRHLLRKISINTV